MEPTAFYSPQSTEGSWRSSIFWCTLLVSNNPRRSNEVSSQTDDVVIKSGIGYHIPRSFKHIFVRLSVSLIKLKFGKWGVLNPPQYLMQFSYSQHFTGCPQALLEWTARTAHEPSPRNLTQECHLNIFTLLLFRSSANSYRVTDTWDCKVKVASKNQDQGKKKNPQRQSNQIKYKYNVLELFNHTVFFNKEVVMILQYFLLA